MSSKTKRINKFADSKDSKKESKLIGVKKKKSIAINKIFEIEPNIHVQKLMIDELFEVSKLKMPVNVSYERKELEHFLSELVYAINVLIKGT